MEQNNKLLFLCGNIYNAFYLNQQPTKSECLIIKNDLVVLTGTISDAKTYLNQINDFSQIDQAIQYDIYFETIIQDVRLVIVYPKTQMIMPGFIDSHCHPISGAMQEGRCRIQGLLDWQQATEKIIQHIQSEYFGENEWIFVYGYSQSWFLHQDQKIELLDQISSTNPIVIMRDDLHCYWVNSVAIKLANIREDTKSPDGGLIERDNEGKINGSLADTAMNLMYYTNFQFQFLQSRCHFPLQTFEDRINNLDKAFKILFKHGIVGFCDAAVKEVMFSVYMERYKRQGIKPLAYLSLCWNQLFLDQLQNHDITMTLDHLDKQIGQYNKLVREQVIDSKEIQCRSVKLFIDGVIESKTAYLNNNYCGCQQHKGVLMISEEQLKQLLPALLERNLQAHMHSIGDAATDLIIQILETMDKQKLKDVRNYLAHLQFVTIQSVQKFKELSLGCNFSPYWFYEYPQYSCLSLIENHQELLSRMYPICDLKQNIIGFGSDWPVSSLNPLWGIEVSITRQPKGYEGDFIQIGSLEQRLNIYQALNYYTLGSAYHLHIEKEAGSLELGKRGDFIVLDKDLTQIPSNKISTCRVLATFIKGQQCF